MRIANVSLPGRRRRPLPSAGCWAPDSTLYFGPDGSVRACCVNTEYPLGHVGEQSIREIWDGARTSALRSALAAGDFSLGCQECGAHEAAGNRAWSNAPQFDEYAGIEVPEHPVRMDFILSNTCNLMCEMCHGGLSSAIRAKREKLPPLPKAYGDGFFEELREFLPHLQKAVFLGGEPFLARESRRVWDLMLEMGLQIPTTVVTNGTQWNERVERYLREVPMDVTVSVDGATAETVEALRLGTDFTELRANMDRYQAIVEARGGHLSLHFCLMQQNWHELADYLLDADAHGRSVGIMTVTDPVRFSLFHLPPDRLREVLSTWEDQDRIVARRLTTNRAVWSSELDRLRRHLAALERGAEPVWTSQTSEAPEEHPEDVLAFERATREAEAGAGRPPLVLEARDGVVHQIAAPSWAEGMGSAAWVGTEVSALAARLAEVLGEAGPPEGIQDGGVHCSTTTFRRASTTAEVRAVAIERRHEGASSLVLHLYLPVDAPLPATA